MSDSARLFFALDPDPATRSRILARQSLLGLPGRVVAAERLHATLAFLGDQPRDRVGALCALAGSLELPRLSLSLDRVGIFFRAGVAWLGARRVPAALVEFHRQLVERLDRAGFEVDRKPWILHVTLYRDLRTRHGRMPIEPVNWALTEFVLMESVPGSNGPTYGVLGRWPAQSLCGTRDRL